MTMHNDFHHGQYSKVVSSDTSALSAEASLPARILQLRAQIALGQASDVLAEISSDAAGDEPDLAAVRALAQYGSGETDEGLKEAEELAAAYEDNGTVQVLAGTVLAAAGKSEEALALLSKHSGSLEA